jgi:hypothetical protein
MRSLIPSDLAKGTLAAVRCLWAGSPPWTSGKPRSSRQTMLLARASTTTGHGSTPAMHAARPLPLRVGPDMVRSVAFRSGQTWNSSVPREQTRGRKGVRAHSIPIIVRDRLIRGHTSERTKEFVLERTEFLEGDAPTMARALVPSIRDALLESHDCSSGRSDWSFDRAFSRAKSEISGLPVLVGRGRQAGSRPSRGPASRRRCRSWYPRSAGCRPVRPRSGSSRRG